MLVSTYFARFTSANWEKEVLMNWSRESRRLTSSYKIIVVTIATIAVAIYTLTYRLGALNPLSLRITFFPFFSPLLDRLVQIVAEKGLRITLRLVEYKFFPAVLLSLNLLAALSEARRLRNLL